MEINPGNAFGPRDLLRQLIHDEPQLLMVIRRFDVALGFGNATVEQVCRERGIDCDTFLAVANFSTGRDWQSFKVDVAALMRYLKNAHKYFLEFALPAIRRKLLEALPTHDPHDITMLILKYFDDYVGEVRSHMDFEDENVFPYVTGLLEGNAADDFDFAAFGASHEPLAPKLQELKEIFVSHYRPVGNEDLINSTLFDIINCVGDIAGHCAVEDNILVPAVREIMDHNRELARRNSRSDGPTGQGAGATELSNRECEVVACIARGLSTKEIADRLNLSAHTVNTHRRNICSKLDIHSAAGLTIYAIIHGLVDIADIHKL
ncbi:MAG: LuxR C-terminal-related transcriptional regulator [Muribaculaceae bacterium]